MISIRFFRGRDGELPPPFGEGSTRSGAEVAGALTAGS
jgi:hypothetical protein